MPKQFYAEGAYIGTVLEQGFGESKDKKTPFFFLKVRVEADEAGRVDKSYERTVERYITEATIPYLAEDLQAIGFQWKDSFNDLHPLNPKHHSFVGNPVSLYCKHDGEYEKWSISKPLGGKPVEQLGSAEMRRLDNMFGKAMKGGAPATAPKPAAVRQAVPAGGISDEDVPFS